jgi:hypothetical protein
MIKNTKKANLLIGSFMIVMIVFIPYLLYAHKFVNEDIESFKTIFGTIKGGQYMYAQTYIYMFLSKFVPLMLLILWFITNKHWWVHALIIPITVYLFQLISVINDSEEFVDEIEFIYTVPIAILIMVILYYLRSKMSIYIQAMDLKKEMDANMKTPTKID